MADIERIALGPYVNRFLVVFVLLQIGLLFLTQLAQIPANPGMAIGVLIGAGLVAGQKFLTDHKRPFTDTEKLRMSFYSLLVVLFIYAIRAGLGLMHFARRLEGMDGGSGFAGLLEKFDWNTFAMLAGGTAIMSFITLFFTYGFLMSMIYRGMAKRGEL